MPPKKKARQAPSIKQDFLASLSRDLDSNSSHTDVTPEQLLRAFGLAGPRAGAPDDEHLHRSCVNRWAEGGVEVVEEEAAPEVVVLSSSEDELELAPQKSAKGKGKGKAKGKEVCSAENCGKNPRCPNWLGQEKWEDAVKAMRAFRKAAGIGDDPSNEREADLPVGLRNLGATCYVNSFLQVWFQDETFRSGVYACLPPANGNVESSPLFQLQVLFAFLQTAQQAVYNPEPLVMSLKLDKGEQKDAQEFSKLFMSLLDHEFKKQGIKAASEGGPNVAALVQEQFEGTITYGTECSACATKSERHSAFLEMEVNLTKNCNLEARIKESLKDEPMSGDNQYYCETCDKKRDATRYTALENLPPVLHISLLRFIFSAEDYTRSKSQHAISYPLKLDMGQFLPPDAHGERSEVWYDLKGVLMHKGVSAHHGHYVAQVHDARKNKWFLFDDETVSPIEDLNAPHRYDEEEEVVARKPKRPQTGFVRTANGDILRKSKDAYMLVYTKRADPLQAQLPEPVPPPLALAQVELLDSIHDAEVKEFQEKESLVKVDFDRLREAKQSVYRVWDVREDDEESFLIDKSELRRWIEQGLKPTTSKALESNGKSEVVVVESAGPSNVVTDSGILDATSAPKFDESTAEASPKLEPTRVSPIVEGEEPQDEMEVDEPVEQDPNVISNVNITCPHGMVNPLQAEQCKRVSQLGGMALHDLGVRLEPELMIPRDICRQCVWGIVAEHLYESEHTEQVAKFEKAATVGSEDGVSIWISRQWLDDWRRPLPKMHSPNVRADPHPGTSPYLQRVLCEHGKLPATRGKDRTLISFEAASFLQDIFPEWEPVTTEMLPCDDCAAALEDSKESDGAMREIAKKEKNVLRLDGQTRLGGSQIIIVPGKPSFVVPLDFARKWVGWSRRPTMVPRPAKLDNSAFLCKHQRLLLDINAEIESASTINVVSEPEWRLLRSAYDAGPAVKILVDDDSNYQTVPTSCASCLEETRKDFSTTQIKIKMLTEEDFDETGSRKQGGSSPSEHEVAERAPAPAKAFGSMTSISSTRTSARLKKRPQLMFAKTLKTLEIAKEDSVKDLKVKISSSFDIPTIYQRLFIEGRELDNDETVDALGLCRGALLELFEVKVDDNISLDQLDDTIDPSVRPKRGKKSREEGFGGTGLFGFESQEKELRMDVDDDDEVIIVASGSGSTKKKVGSNVKNSRRKANESRTEACPTCTFEQEAGGTECSCCGLPMQLR